MKIRAITLALSLTGAVGLSACAPGSGSDDDVLTVWSWRTEDVEAYNRIFDEFEKEHPGITVEFEAFQNTEYDQILTTGLTGDDGPDVANVRSYGELQPLIEAKQIEPLGDQVSGLRDFSPTVLAGATGRADGKLYAVPGSTQTLQMFYNKGIFADLGLEVPKTWDEFIAVNETLLDNDLTPMAVGGRDSWILPILADVLGSGRYGGTAFEKDILAGKAKFTDPDYVASLKLLEDLKKYFTSDLVGVSYTESQLQFTSGQAAQFPGGAFEIRTFNKQAPDLDLGSYQVPLPPGAVSQTPVSPAWTDGNFAINTKSDKKDDALELLNWIASKDFGQLAADELKAFSPVPGVTYSDPTMKEVWANYQAGPAPYLLLVDFRYGDPRGTDVLATEIQKMLLGKTDAAGAAASLQEGVSHWFEPQQ